MYGKKFVEKDFQFTMTLRHIVLLRLILVLTLFAPSCSIPVLTYPVSYVDQLTTLYIFWTVPFSGVGYVCSDLLKVCLICTSIRLPRKKKKLVVKSKFYVGISMENAQFDIIL